MKRLFYLVSATFGMLAGFSLTAHAANAVDPSDGALDLAKGVFDAFTGRHYAYGAALALVVAVALVRKQFGAKWQWMHTDAGSAAMVLAGSFGATLVAALSGGGPLTLATAWAAAGVAFTTAGGYAMVKKLLVQPIAPKLPSWAGAALLWLFQHASDPSQNQGAGNTTPAQSVPQDNPHA